MGDAAFTYAGTLNPEMQDLIHWSLPFFPLFHAKGLFWHDRARLSKDTTLFIVEIIHSCPVEFHFSRLQLIWLMDIYMLFFLGMVNI